MKPILSTTRLHDVFPEGVTKDALAKYYGLTKFDTAIPQILFDQLVGKPQNHDDPDPNFHPWGHYVFDYSFPTNEHFGTLFPLTQEGVDRYESVFKIAFEDPRC